MSSMPGPAVAIGSVPGPSMAMGWVPGPSSVNLGVGVDAATRPGWPTLVETPARFDNATMPDAATTPGGSTLPTTTLHGSIPMSCKAKWNPPKTEGGPRTVRGIGTHQRQLDLFKMIVSCVLEQCNKTCKRS